MSIMDNLDWREPANDNRPCLTCGGEVTGRVTKKYCGKQCSRIAERSKRDMAAELARRKETAPEWECEHCGSTFRRHRHKKNAARFCSRECGFAAKSNVWVGPTVSSGLSAAAMDFDVSFAVTRCVCRQCGVRFNGENLTDKWCSSECRRVAYVAANDNVDRSARPCAECGVDFCPEYGMKRRRFCSPPCAKRSGNRTKRKKERARKRGATVETVDPNKVFDRDGWRCQLCGVKTPRKLRGTDKPNAPELDHIVPLAKGGEHSYRNTHCACKACNAAKSDTPLGQMRLFG